MTRGWLLLLPEFTLLAGAMLSLALGVARASGYRRIIAPAAMLIVLLAGIAASLNPESGTAVPFPGLLITELTHYVRIVTLALGAGIVLANWHQPIEQERGEFFSLILFSISGVLLTAMANDWLTLFLAVELVSVPTYILVGMSRTDARASEASLKYFFLGALAAAVLAYGLTFLYGASGTTQIVRFVDGAWHSTLQAGPNWSAMQTVGCILVLGGLAFKIAAVPIHAYIADVYEGASASISGMLGFVPKAAGFVAILKLLQALDWKLPTSIFWVLWAMAALSMIVGNALGLRQRNIKRLLAYSSISHSGYMLIGVVAACASRSSTWASGASALLFYLVVYGTMNLGAFALMAALQRNGLELETMDDVAGLALPRPAASLAFSICIFSLMGLPLTAGFLAKVYVVGAAIQPTTDPALHFPMLILSAIAVLNTAIGAAYYLKTLAGIYLQRGVSEQPNRVSHPAMCCLALCAFTMIVLFARPSILLDSARQAIIRSGVVAVRESSDSNPSQALAQVLVPNETDSASIIHP